MGKFDTDKSVRTSVPFYDSTEPVSTLNLIDIWNNIERILFQSLLKDLEIWIDQ